MFTFAGGVNRAVEVTVNAGLTSMLTQKIKNTQAQACATLSMKFAI
jgi:hypothetical protein